MSQKCIAHPLIHIEGLCKTFTMPTNKHVDHGGNADDGHSVSCESGHTTNHLNCPACTGATVLLLSLDKGFSRLPFQRAAELWQELRKRGHLKDRTHIDNDLYVRALNKFFGELRLCDIKPGHLKAYQDARTANLLITVDGRETRPWMKPAGHSIINHEMSCLGQILNHANLWKRLKPYYFPLSIPKWSPRDVLTVEDEDHLFSVAASHPEAALAYWCACITNNTTAVGIELRGLRMKHIFLREAPAISEIYIPEDAVKNTSRPRKIALNTTARWAVGQCYKRALRLGATDPNHYLFPFRVNKKKWDPARPASRWFLRKSWEKLRTATGFAYLTPHHLRHQCITRLLESGVHGETVRAIAGHVTTQMMEYYSHIRAQAKYDAVMAIELNERERVKRGPQIARRRTA